MYRGSPRVTASERAALRPIENLFGVENVAWGVFALVCCTGFGVLMYQRRGERGRKRARKKYAGASAEALSAVAEVEAEMAAMVGWIDRISVGFDWTAREMLQGRLAELARTMSVASNQDRARAAREVLALMSSHAGAARHAHVSAKSVKPSGAGAQLRVAADDLRARFRHETDGRGAGGPEPEVGARAEEGPGFIVVTILLGSLENHTKDRVASHRKSLAALLDHLQERIEALHGIEVVWSPAKSDDRLSSYELERWYPELERLDVAHDIGSVACPHCGSPFPREIGRCPRCGAHAPD